LRHSLGTLELPQAFQFLTSRDASQTFTNQQLVHELAVLQKQVRETSTIHIVTQVFIFEAHPTARHEAGEPLLGFTCKRRRRIQPPPNFRRIDAQQANPANADHVDRVAVENLAHQDRRRPFLRGGPNMRDVHDREEDRDGAASQQGCRGHASPGHAVGPARP
jgi:hypothetical protein